MIESVIRLRRMKRLKIQYFAIILVPILNFLAAQVKEPCDNYLEESNHQRSTAFIAHTESRSFMCDRPFLTGWYRFTSGAGGEMPTSCPNNNACGSIGSSWLNGSLPETVNEQKTVKVCANLLGICCSVTWDIEVKKCSKNGNDFFIYKLVPVPLCPIAYCAGSEKKCLPGETSPNGFTPGCARYPNLKKDPEVAADIHNKRLRYSCTIDSDDKSDDVRHNVTWYEGAPEKLLSQSTVLKGTQSIAYFQNKNSFIEDPEFHLGKNIYCKVRTYRKGLQGGNIKTSKQFFAGLKITPKKVVSLPNDRTGKIKIESTVPIACVQISQDQCLIKLEFLHKDQLGIFIDKIDPCAFEISTKSNSHELEVVTKLEDHDPFTMFINFFVNPHVFATDWRGYKDITKVEVKVEKLLVLNRRRQCSSTGDPHLRSLDDVYFDHYHIGDYLYVHSKARKFQVHVRTYQCNTVSCNCGVAVREGDDVIVVDMCQDNVPRARFASSVKPQEGTIIKRSPNGKNFELTFPSGASVQFNALHWFGPWHYANIYINVPDDDDSNTIGLCGSNNGNRVMTGKDGKTYNINKRTFIGQAPKDYTESWKLRRDESLFYYKDDGKRKCETPRVRRYCSCDIVAGKKTATCKNVEVNKKVQYQNKNRWKTLKPPDPENCGKRRKRRSTTVQKAEDVIILPDDNENAIYEYNPRNFTPIVESFPTQSGMTKDRALSECSRAVRNSTIGKVCLNLIPDLNISGILTDCVSDIQILDQIKPAIDSAVENLAANCEEITLREVQKYWKNNSNGVLEPPVTIGNSLCPNDCSRQGQCLNSTCICNEGYVSSDCSIKKGEPPVMIGAAFNGLCDIRKQNCRQTRIIGYNFIESKNLLCRSTEVELNSTYQLNTIGSGENRTGYLLSFAELSCELPRVPVVVKAGTSNVTGKPIGGFYIQLSNDGKTFSENRTLFLVYDSKCMDCSINGSNEQTCKMKANTCKINNYCYVNGDINPTNWCEMCNASKSNSSFTENTNNLPPTFKNVSKQYAFKGQAWDFQVLAEDPEDKGAVKFELLGDTFGMKISKSGNVTWSPQEYNKTYEFTVRAIDICGKFSEQKYEVETRRCPCENGGTCVWVNEGTERKAQCVCPSGCTGSKCLDSIDGMTCQRKIEPEKPKKLQKIVISIAVVVGSFIIIYIITFFI